MGRDRPHRIDVGKVDQESVIYYIQHSKKKYAAVAAYFFYPTISLEILSRYNKEKRF